MKLFLYRQNLFFIKETDTFGHIFAGHNIAKGIKPGSDSKKTDMHAADCSKAVCSGVK